MSVKNKAFIAIIIAAILWASAGTVAKLLFRETSPFVVATHRFTLASLLILPFFLREKKPKGYLQKLLPLGLFNAGNILFYYSGLALTTANTSSILGSAIPITVVILSALIIHEHISKNKIIGIIIGLIGALLIVLLPLLGKGDVSLGNMYGNILLIGSLLSWSLYIVYSRSILTHGTFSPILSTSVNIFTVMIAATIASLIVRQPLITPSLLSPSYLAILLYAAIGVTIVTFFLFQWGVQYVSASTASLKEYIQLVIGVGINMLVLGERLTPMYVIGSIFIVIGVIVATGQRVSRKLASILFSQGE